MVEFRFEFFFYAPTFVIHISFQTCAFLVDKSSPPTPMPNAKAVEIPILSKKKLLKKKSKKILT